MAYNIKYIIITNSALVVGEVQHALIKIPIRIYAGYIYLFRTC